MIRRRTSVCTTVALLSCALVFIFPPQTPAAAREGGDPYARDVTRRGSVVAISKNLADAVKKDNRIVLSKVAVKMRLDRQGELRAYELVQVDKGSVVDKMGLRPGDLLTSINGIGVRDLDDKDEAKKAALYQTLEQANRFDVTVLRKGKTVNLTVRVR